MIINKTHEYMLISLVQISFMLHEFSTDLEFSILLSINICKAVRFVKAEHVEYQEEK